MTTHRPQPVVTRLGRTDLERLGPQWDRLVSEAAPRGVFLGWPWVSAWLATMGSDADLEIVVSTDPGDGTLHGIAPFFVATDGRGLLRRRSLKLIGAGPACPDHLDLVIHPDAHPDTARVLWEAVQRDRRWDQIDLDGVDPDGFLAALLLRRKGDLDRVDRVQGFSLALSASWDETIARFGSGIVTNLGRYSRKLDREAGGAVEGWMVADAKDLQPTMETLAVMHRALRLSRDERGAFRSPALTSFQFEVARRMLAAGRLRLWRLDVAGEPIAIIECFRHGDTVSFYTTGYHQQWARYGPGRAVMAMAIEGAIAEGATTFDFLRGNESYKSAWAAEPTHDYRIRQPVTVKGRVFETARLTRRTLRRSVV